MQLDGGTERDGTWFSCSLHRAQIGTYSYLQQQDYDEFCRTETEKPAVVFPAGLAIGVSIYLPLPLNPRGGVGTSDRFG